MTDQDDWPTEHAKKVYGNEAVVPWLIIGAVLAGLLTRSVIGAIVGAVVVYILWLIVVKAFGGQFRSKKIEASKLVRYCLIGGLAGFAGDFAINAGVSS